MSVIKIEWLSDDWDCETCGSDYAEGARVTIDGEVVILMEPVAHCFSGQTYDSHEVFKAILEHLGHEVEGE